jgi:hypothetical protein
MKRDVISVFAVLCCILVTSRGGETGAARNAPPSVLFFFAQTPQP